MSLCFFEQWLKAPATVGAVAPSSRCLADAMAHGVESFEAIVEVGAGTGVATDSLVRRHPSARLIVFELGDQFAADLRGRFPQAHVVGGAFHKNVSVLQDLPAKTIIVSGLPFRSLSSGVVEPTVAAFAELLYADQARRLVQFTYQPRVPFVAPKGLCWHRIKTVWLNAPPASVWHLGSRTN
jgi:phosphatidylethanolamine/phosphatidyl-N-methylethanolamine N-methyltransferase